MNLVYPAIFHNENNTYWVEFPDLPGCQSFGDSLEETAFNAKEALEAYALTILEDGEKLNKPSRIQDVKADNNSFVSLVCGDIKNYISQSRAVKKTLTIPQWLNDRAMEEHINFSQTLQNALIEQLHLQK